jgi:hypothetical protein
MVLLAAVAAGPAVSAIDDTWATGNVIVHCSPAGETVESDKLRFRVIVPPGTVDPDDRFRLPACAHRTPAVIKTVATALKQDLKHMPPQAIVLRVKDRSSAQAQPFLVFLAAKCVNCSSYGQNTIAA